MEQRPVQLLVDIIPIKDSLQLLIEGGTITNITSSQQQIKISSTPAYNVRINFVQEDQHNEVFPEKTDMSDEEDEEEIVHDHGTPKPQVPLSKPSILEQCLRNQLALSNAQDEMQKACVQRPVDGMLSNAALVAAMKDSTPHLTNGHVNHEPQATFKNNMSKICENSRIPENIRDDYSRKEEQINQNNHEHLQTANLHGEITPGTCTATSDQNSVSIDNFDRPSEPTTDASEKTNTETKALDNRLNNQIVNEQASPSKQEPSKIEQMLSSTIDNSSGDQDVPSSPTPQQTNNSPSPRKRKRGRPFKKDTTKDSPNVPKKKARTNDAKLRTRSRSRPGEETHDTRIQTCQVLPPKENMSKFIKREIVANSLPDFVCQLCGFRLDQERYVQKHVRLRHAGQWHESVVDEKKPSVQNSPCKEETDAVPNSRRQGHYTRNRRSKGQRNLSSDDQEETDQPMSPDSKPKNSEKESSGLNGINECSLCGKNFPSRHSFHSHIETVHNIPVESRIPHHTCNKCQIEFVQLTTYENHMLNVHNSANKITCTVEGCNAKVNTPAGLKRHIARKHGSSSPLKALASPTSGNASETVHDETMDDKDGKTKEPVVQLFKEEEIHTEKHNELSNETEKPKNSAKANTKQPSPMKIDEPQTEITIPDKIEPLKIEIERPRVSRPECKTCGKRFISQLNLQRHEETCIADKPRPEAMSPVQLNEALKAMSEQQSSVPDANTPSKSPVLIRDNNNTITKPPSVDGTPLKIPQIQLQDIALSPKMMLSPNKRVITPVKEDDDIEDAEEMYIPTPVANFSPPKLQSAPMINIKPEDPLFHVSVTKISRSSASPKMPKMKCKMCGLKFISAVNLERHEKYAHTKMIDTCPYPDCAKTFDSPMSLKCHIGRMHSEKNHPCDQCHKSFGTVTSLRSHIKTVHQKIKDLNCPWEGCGKTFGRSSHLDNHMKRHRGEMNFGCQYCDYKCIQRASLNYHMRHSHPNEVYCRLSTKVKHPSTGDSPSHSPSSMSPGPMSPPPPKHTPHPPAVIPYQGMRLPVTIASNVSFDNM